MEAVMSPPSHSRSGASAAEPSAAASDGLSSGGAVGRDQPAADWICVASARDILIVDDNDRHLDILGTILASVGHDIETCGSGAEALRLMSMRHYDVVVLDLVMPEINGLTVATQMREDGLNADTPVIVCTANVNLARRQLADVQGITDIVAKPIDTASLVLAVARAPLRPRPAPSKRSDEARF